jgi:hypothetical protein
MRSMAFQPTTKFFPDSRWVFGSLLFGADKFGDLSLQEPESLEVTMSGTDHLPPAPVRVSFINKAQLRHGSIELGGGKMNSDPLGDKVDHNLASSIATTDPIYQLPAESDSKGDWEVYMVRQGEELPEKTAEEITREAEEEIA